MSTTAPMHWTMVPLAWACDMSSFLPFSLYSLNGGRAAYDFRNFLGDRRLAVLVVDQGQLVDQRVGVVGGRLHRHHARRLLGAHVLGHGLVDQRLDVAGHDLVEDRTRLWLVDVVPYRLGGAEALAREGQQLLDHRL